MRNKRARDLRIMAYYLQKDNPGSLPKNLREGPKLYKVLKKIWTRFKCIPEGTFHESF